MSRWTEHTGITPETRAAVLDRDRWCVICGSNYGLQCAHVVPRSRGGRGIETNLVMLCAVCHDRYDKTTRRKEIKEQLINYLSDLYGGWEEEEQIYHK